MKQLHIITPVKDSIELTLQTIESILSSDFTVPYHYYVYNDFSTDENTARLREASEKMGFELINLSDLTDHPSPNYLLILQTAQQKAIAADAGLLIVESDVIVKKHTLQSLFDGALTRPDCGIAAAVTVDEQENINYPYLYAKGKEGKVFPEKKHVSFCCSLLISHRSLEKGFTNYLFTTLTVWHRPHGSRPWKQLKYTNPLKYYWLKFTKGLDKI